MAPATKSPGKPKEGSRGRSPSTSSDGKRPRKTSSRKSGGSSSKPPPSKASKSLLLPFITLWLLAVIALAGLIYWGIEEKHSSSRIQESHKSKTAPPAERRTASQQKQPTNERRAQTSSSIPRQINRTVTGSSASSPEIREYNIPIDSTPAKPPVPDQARPHIAASSGNLPEPPSNLSPADVPAPKRTPSAEAGRVNNPSEIRIEVAPSELSPPKPSEQTRAAESTIRAAVPASKAPEPVPGNLNASAESSNTAESRTHSASSANSTSTVVEPAHTNGVPHLAMMSPANGRESVPPAPPHPPTPSTAAPLARVAIVIDDFGMDLEMAKRFLRLPIPITFSILPYQPHSREIAQLVHSEHGEAILHMPMEPQEYPKVNPGKGALLVAMSAATMQKTIRTALDFSPHIAGMNNHMGSRFTENAAFMEIVLSELHQRRLYFLDSWTSPRSTGTTVARKLHVPSRQRDIFLDHKVSEENTLAQIEQLIRKAKIKGTAIAIGHPHESTLRALQRRAERFRKERIEVVPLGTMISE